MHRSFKIHYFDNFTKKKRVNNFWNLTIAKMGTCLCSDDTVLQAQSIPRSFESMSKVFLSSLFLFLSRPLLFGPLSLTIPLLLSVFPSLFQESVLVSLALLFFIYTTSFCTQGVSFRAYSSTTDFAFFDTDNKEIFRPHYKPLLQMFLPHFFNSLTLKMN